jgi:hypothetical protein
MRKIIFLHHSTGSAIWLGNTNRYFYKLTKNGDVQKFFKEYNSQNGTNFSIEESVFPKEILYGWNNYPFDYYNIWVKNAGEKPYKEEPTLEMLTRDFEIIVFKHCFPVSRIKEDTALPDIDSEEKRLENYKLQYNALKKKIHEFPHNKFIVWTPATYTKSQMTEEEAKRTKQFHDWVVDEWDEQGDNIFIWDFYQYETEGTLYLLDKYSSGNGNPHPNQEFSGKVAPFLCKFIIDVADSRLK